MEIEHLDPARAALGDGCAARCRRAHPHDPGAVKEAHIGLLPATLLRSLDVETLILGGIATAGVVLSTLRDAVDRDYRLLVLSDCCLDRDAEDHRVWTEKLSPPHAEVLTVQTFEDRLSARRTIQ